MLSQRAQGHGDAIAPVGMSADELAALDAPLEEWDRLRVRDYWSSVVASELGSFAPMVGDVDVVLNEPPETEHTHTTVVSLGSRRHRGDPTEAARLLGEAA